MSPTPMSFWQQTQLVLLRFLSLGLGAVDRLLNVRWGEHLLQRMANRWQAQLEQLDQTLAQLNEERQQIQSQTEALNLQVAAIHLGGRKLARGELCFDPAVAHDEKILDASIDLLVKQRLAAIEPEEIEPGHFIYHLEPDWPAIRSRLGQAADQAEPEMAEWFRETLQLIDEALLPQASAGTPAPSPTQDQE